MVKLLSPLRDVMTWRQHRCHILAVKAQFETDNIILHRLYKTDMQNKTCVENISDLGFTQQGFFLLCMGILWAEILYRLRVIESLLWVYNGLHCVK